MGDTDDIYNMTPDALYRLMNRKQEECNGLIQKRESAKRRFSKHREAMSSDEWRKLNKTIYHLINDIHTIQRLLDENPAEHVDRDPVMPLIIKTRSKSNGRYRYKQHFQPR